MNKISFEKSYRTELILAHKKACYRDNASTQILIATFAMNGGNLIKSVTAAMMTLGGVHAPILQVLKVLKTVINQESFYTLETDIIPGFGSAFVKGEPDPILSELDILIRERKDINEAKRYFMYLLNERNKTLFPNLAFYTAAFCIIEKISNEFCEKIILEARIPEWIKILEAQHNEQKATD